MNDKCYKWNPVGTPKKVTKLKITRPNGTSEIIEVTEYKEYDPKSVVPDTVCLTPHFAMHNTVYKSTFLAILKNIKLGEGAWNAEQYAFGLLGINMNQAKELVDAI